MQPIYATVYDSKCSLRSFRWLPLVSLACRSSKPIESDVFRAWGNPVGVILKFISLQTPPEAMCAMFLGVAGHVADVTELVQSYLKDGAYFVNIHPLRLG